MNSDGWEEKVIGKQYGSVCSQTKITEVTNARADYEKLLENLLN